MFPLLDLDDDAIKVALGFSDPRSLSSTTMTCRRLRHLSDAAWNELDKHIEQNKCEGGDTPRERVLSSFVVHGGGRSWLDRITFKAARARNAGICCVSSEDLQNRTYIFHICTENLGYPMHALTIPVSVGGQPNLGFFGHCARVSIDLPLERKHFHLFGNIQQFLRDFYDSQDFSSKVFMPGSRQLSPTFDFNRFKMAFRLFKVTILAVDRCTLEPKILFREEINSPSSQRPPSVGTSQRKNRRRLEIKNKWSMKCFDRGAFIGTREVEFYFEKDSFGLTICNMKD